MSTMKHLPIKSNDARDLKGITVKWCIQWDYGHLQMAGVQESPLVALTGKETQDEPGKLSAIIMS